MGAAGLTMATQGERSATLALPPSNRREFLEQATTELQRAAHRYARQRAAMVRRAGARIDHLYAGELVQDALADTWLGGEVAWDPKRCSLLEHIRGLIRARSWRDVVGARQRPHLSLDWNEELTIEIDETQRHGTQINISPIVLARVTVTVVQDLRRLAAGDPAATGILAAWEDGLVDKDEIMDRTGLGDREYKTARARLMYLVLSLPHSLRETARSLLRGRS
jgi:hypothetical protein